jgi:hypothetical protein
MYDLYPNQRAEGEVLFDGGNILSPKQDLNLLRARIGMVFQKPTPFPMTIYDNIAFGIVSMSGLSKSELDGASRSPAPRGDCGTRSRTSCGERPEPLRRPAAALVHRAHRRRAARGDPAR